ncbi:unnamed protein product [Bubo scandiacus]
MGGGRGGRGLRGGAPGRACGTPMGEAPAPELDAVLGGGGWDVGANFEGPPPPTGPVRLGRNACYVVLAVLFNEEVRQPPPTPPFPSVGPPPRWHPLPRRPLWVPAGRGAAGAGGQGRVPREVVPAGRQDGARRGHRGRHEEGGEGGDGAGVPTAQPAGAGGEGAGLDPLRLPRAPHRWDPEDPGGGRRRVPASGVVGRGPPCAAAASPRHPALAGPRRPLPPQPPAPPHAAAGAALRLALPEAPADLRQRYRGPLGAAGRNRDPPPARGGLWHVPGRAPRGSLPACAAAAAGLPTTSPPPRDPWGCWGYSTRLGDLGGLMASASTWC